VEKIPKTSRRPFGAHDTRSSVLPNDLIVS
jgi:hypothetical protein